MSLFSLEGGFQLSVILDNTKYRNISSSNNAAHKGLIYCGQMMPWWHGYGLTLAQVMACCLTARAGVLVLGTRTHSTWVLNFWYSCCSRIREFQSNSTRTCTRGQVLRYSYEYWHEYWYSMVTSHDLWCEGENHHYCEINNLTYHEGKVPNWFILLLWLNIWYMGCDCKFHNVFQFYYHRKINWITIMMFML